MSEASKSNIAFLKGSRRSVRLSRLSGRTGAGPSEKYARPIAAILTLHVRLTIIQHDEWWRRGEKLSGREPRGGVFATALRSRCDASGGLARGG